MAEEKRFFDIFLRYKPSEEKRALLERGHSAKFKYAKEPMSRVKVAEREFRARHLCC